MDHGGEAARPTTPVGSADLGTADLGMVQGGGARMSARTFHGLLGAAAAARRAGFDEFARRPSVADANIGEFWRQLLGPAGVGVVLVGLQRTDGVVQANDSSFYSALQHRPGAGPGVVIADLLPAPGGAGAVYNEDYALLPRPGAGHGEVLVDLLTQSAGVVYNSYICQPSPATGHGHVFVGLLPDGAGHGEGFVGQPRGGGGAAYDDYCYFELQPTPGAGHGEVLVDLFPEGDGHGEVFVDLLPGGGVYPWQPRPGAGRGEVFFGLLPDGVGLVFDGLGNFAQQHLTATGRADGIAGALRGYNLGAGPYDDNHGMVAEHLRRLLPFVGIGASSVAVNGLAAGPGSPAVAFHLFVLLLGGLLLVILHVLRV